jgi:hypothetical protein
MTAFVPALMLVARNGLIVVALWATLLIAGGSILTRKRHPRAHRSTDPAEKTPLTRDDFTLAA